MEFKFCLHQNKIHWYLYLIIKRIYYYHPALIAYHLPFPVTHWAAKRWLHHMQQALDGTMDIDADSKVRMMNFFRYKIFWLKTFSHLYFTSCNIQFSLLSSNFITLYAYLYVFLVHSILSCSWRWVEESKPTTSM